jgi:hypothetical protein
MKLNTKMGIWFLNLRESYVHGKIEKSKPQTSYPFFHSDPLNMKISDIEGTQYGSRNKINRFQSKHSGIDISDIVESKFSSLKKGIVTQRNTNPLDPNYVLPGSKNIMVPENNPFARTTSHIKPNYDPKVEKYKTHNKIGENYKSNIPDHVTLDKGDQIMTSRNENFRLNTENNFNKENDFANDINDVIYCNTEGDM